MLISPRLILADEVTEGVQPIQVSRIAEVLRACRERDGTAMLIVEQHLDLTLGNRRPLCVDQAGDDGPWRIYLIAWREVEIERQLAL